MAVITIIGAGMMGSAMSRPATDNGHTVRLVGTPLDREIIDRAKKDGYHLTLKRDLPEGVVPYRIEDVEEALEGADLVLGGVSSFGVEWFESFVLPLLKPGTRVLSITKGLRAEPDGRLIPFPRRMASLRPDVSFNAVGGPCISFELMDRWDTRIAFCGADMGILEELKAMFETSYYHITPTTDIEGLECAVAMKNAYAMGVSLAIGAVQEKLGDDDIEKYNPQAGLFAQSVRETAKLIEMTGGRPDAVAWNAGDLYVTIFGGRTRRLGTLLGRGLPFEKAREILAGVTLEAVAITRAVTDALEARSVPAEEFPLLFRLKELLFEGAVVSGPESIL